MSESGSVSRREFLQAAAVAVPTFAGAVMVPRAVQASAFVGEPEQIRLGIIGCGGRGTGAATQALKADKACRLVAMGDVFKDRLEACHASLTKAMTEAEGSPSRLDVPPERRFVGFDAYKKVLESGVDAVLLTGYPNTRPGHLRAAIEAGKHVFAEKPVAVDAAGIRSVIETSEMAAKKNLALLVGFCWRHNEGMVASFDQIKAGVVGDVTGVHTNYHAGTLARNPRKPEWSDMEFQLRNWWHFTWISGDHIVEQAVHSVDRMAWAMGDVLPTKVTCMGGRAARTGPEHGNVFDHFAAIYEYEDGRRTHHTCRQIDGCSNDNSDYVYGSKGWMHVEGWRPVYRAKDYKGNKLWSFDGEVGDMYQNEHDALFKSIRAGKPINDGVRSANSCMMAIMARMAAYTGETITWEKAINSKEDLSPKSLELGPIEMPAVAIPGKTKIL